MSSETLAIDISAPPDRVWQIVADVESWPQWTPSMTSVRRLDSGPFGVGSRAEVKQPGLPRLVWQVTELDEGTAFTWVARTPGVATTGVHQLSATDSGTRLTLTVAWSGPLAGLVGALTAKRTRQFLAQETSGAKARSESA